MIQAVSSGFPFENLGVMKRGAPGVARRFIQIEAEFSPLLKGDLAVLELTDAKFRPLQIEKDADGTIEPFLDRADGIVSAFVVFVVTVAEIQSENVGAGLEQGGNPFFRGRSRPQGGQNFCAAHSSHNVTTIRADWEFASIYRGIVSVCRPAAIFFWRLAPAHNAG